MKLIALSLLALSTATVAATPVEDRSGSAAIEAAIEAFVPCQTSKTRELAGVVVGIDPVGGGQSAPNARWVDDLSLFTAGHLYHLVKAAGGTAVMTRADDSRAEGAVPKELDRRMRVVREAKCDLCVSIRYDGATEAITIRGEEASPGGPSASLAKAMRNALGAKPAGPGAAVSPKTGLFDAISQSTGASNVPVCEVRFPSPLTGTAPLASARQRCFDNARKLCAGVLEYCAGSPPGSEIEVDSGQSDSTSVPNYPARPPSSRVQRRAASLWPEGRLPNNRLEWFCRLFARTSITNPSLEYFAVKPHVEEGTVVLRGATNVPALVTSLADALRAVDVEEVRTDVRTLPDAGQLGDRLFGACRVPMALTFGSPDERSGLQTQLLYGEPVFLLDQQGGYYLLHVEDGYWGWVRQDAIQPMTAEEFEAYRGKRRGVLLRDVERTDLRIPRGSMLPLVGETQETRTLLLPDGARCQVAASDVATHDSSGVLATRVRSALELLYVPYVFGGRSPLGLDCSGLLANVGARAGEARGRDAWQQAFAGRLVATGWYRTGMQAGDQVFFVDAAGKIYHTGIALNATHVIHAAPPCVQIGSFDPQDRLYDRRIDRDLFMVKRP